MKGGRGGGGGGGGGRGKFGYGGLPLNFPVVVFFGMFRIGRLSKCHAIWPERPEPPGRQVGWEGRREGGWTEWD